MATSGSTDFDLTRNEIITDALINVGAFEQASSIPNEDQQFAARALNRMVKAWQAKGVHLWKTDEAVVFLASGTASYSLGASGDHASLSHVKTEIATAAASGATTIQVDSITGISASDNIGVVVDDGTVHWTTVNGAPSGTTITLTAALDDTAAVDNHVYTYTTLLSRPLRIRGARRRDKEGNDIPVGIWSRDEYESTPNKTATGPFSQIYYDPQLSLGLVYAWLTPDTAEDRLMITGDFQIEDFDASTNTSDLPQEWLDALVWGLSYRLSMSYGVPQAERLEIRAMADQMLEDLMGFDREVASTYFEPDY